MSRPEFDVLEQNVRALLRRAYVPARPAPDYRAALRVAFLHRAADRAEPLAAAPRRRGEWHRGALIGVGLAAAAVALIAWFTQRSGPSVPGELPRSTDGSSVAESTEPIDDRRAEPDPAGIGLADPERHAASQEPERTVDQASNPSAVEPPGASADATCGVHVRVVDAESGAPLPEFTFWSRLEAQLPRVAFATPAEGLAGDASAHDLELGAHTLLVEAEGYASWRLEGVELEPSSVVELEARLERGAPLRGEVRDRDTGAPVAGALVVAELDGPEGALPLDVASFGRLPLAHAITDAAGRYTIPHLSHRAQRLRVLHADYATAWTDEIASPGGEVAPGARVAPPVNLSQGGSVEGWVEREGGAPAVAAEVFLSLISMDRALPVLAYSRAETDTRGRFIAQHLPPGFYVVVAQELAGGVQLRQTTVREGSRSQVRFGVALGSPSLRGLVVGADGEPRPHYQVAVVPEGPDAGAFEDWVLTLTDDEGRFVFEALEPGPYGVYVNRDSAAMTRRDSVVVRADRESEVNLVLEGGELAGQVELGDPDRSLHAMLILAREDPELLESVGPEAEPWVFHAKGDPAPDGSFRFDALPAGRYRVALVGQNPDCGGYLSDPVELLSDETVRVTLEATPGVQVQAVTLTDADEPIDGAVVIFYDAAGLEFPYHPAPVTDSSGRAPSPSLRAGRWTVEATAPGYAPVRRSLDLDPTLGSRLEVELVLESR